MAAKEVLSSPIEAKQELAAARLHAGFQIVDYGTVTTFIDTKEKKNGKAISGEITNTGILLTVDTKPGQTTKVIVPWGNIVHATLK